MTPNNKAIIVAAVDLLSYALDGDNGRGLGFDITWDDDCATIHIITGEGCDHPNTGHQPPAAGNRCNGLEGACMLEAHHTGNHATRVAPITAKGQR